MRERDPASFFAPFSLATAIIAGLGSIITVLLDIWSNAPSSMLVASAAGFVLITSSAVGALLSRNGPKLRAKHREAGEKSAYDLVVVWRDANKRARSGNLELLEADELKALTVLRTGVAYRLEEVSSAALIPPRRTEDILERLADGGLIRVRRGQDSPEPLYIKPFEVEELGER